MLLFSNEASLIYVDNEINTDNLDRWIRYVRIIWVLGRLRYEYHMSIPASASFELGGCSYRNLDEHRILERKNFILELSYLVTMNDPQIR